MSKLNLLYLIHTIGSMSLFILLWIYNNSHCDQKTWDWISDLQ